MYNIKMSLWLFSRKHFSISLIGFEGVLSSQQTVLPNLTNAALVLHFDLDTPNDPTGTYPYYIQNPLSTPPISPYILHLAAADQSLSCPFFPKNCHYGLPRHQPCPERTGRSVCQRVLRFEHLVSTYHLALVRL